MEPSRSGVPQAGCATEYRGGELESMTLAPSYYAWLSDLVRPFLSGTVLDLGAGIGTFSKTLLSPNVTRLICVEPAQNLLPTLRSEMSRYGDRVVVLSVAAEALSSHLDAGSVDAAVSVNVLEHIAEDVEVLRGLRRVLKPAGHLCLFVPAMPILMGSMDVGLGHVRRYTKRELRGKLETAGFRVIQLRYWNSLGAVGWFWAGRVLKKDAVSPFMAKAFDRVGVPFLRVAESRLSLPFGQSLMVVAVRP